MADSFEIRVCENPACGLRYPLTTGHPFGERCPVCLGNTVAKLTRNLSQETLPIPQKLIPTSTLDDLISKPPQFQLEALLDNIRSAWNVGAIFRTADGFGIQKLFLCGITPTPENSSVGKTALGAEATVPWAYSRNALTTAIKLKNAGSHLWALEQDERAIPVYSKFQTDEMPIVLIVGNEVSGVDPDLLDLCERIVYIPMLGKKRSLNVEVAFGAAISVLRTTSLA